MDQMVWREFRSVIVQAAQSWSSHHAARHSAAISFYAMLALAPILVIGVAVSTLFLDAEAVSESLRIEVASSLGEGAADFLIGIIEQTSRPGASVTATILAFLIALYAGSNLFLQMIESVESIWGIKSENHPVTEFFKDRAVSVITLLVFMLLALLWLVADSVLGYLVRSRETFGAWPIISFLTSSLFASLVFALAYRAIPKGRVLWREVWLGAILAGIGFSAAKYALSLYFSYSGVAAAYGSAGALLVILLWIYYTSHIYFFGVEVTRITSERRRKTKHHDHLIA